MKRITGVVLSFVLVLTMMMGISRPVSAASNDADLRNITVQGCDDSVQSYFSEGTEKSILEHISSVDYSYQFEKKSEGETSVTLSFCVNEDENSYSGNVSGVLARADLPSGKVLWEGPLDGWMMIGASKLPVIASFSKMENDDTIQVSITFQFDEKGNTYGLPIVLKFGGTVLTKEVYDEILSIQERVNGQVLSEQDAGASLVIEDGTKSSLYSLLATSTVNLNGDLYGGIAQTLRYYYYQFGKRCAISTQSNTATALSYFGGWSGFATVSYMKIRLYRHSAADPSYIAGIETFDVPNVNTYFNSSVAQYIKLLFEDAVSLLGVPTSTFLAMLNSLKGSVSRSVGTNDYSVMCSFSITQSANFDGANNGMPIVFQLTNGNSSYGLSKYHAKTDITYRVLYVPVGEEDYITAYINSNTAWVACNLQVY